MFFKVLTSCYNAPLPFCIYVNIIVIDRQFEVAVVVGSDSEYIGHGFHTFYDSSYFSERWEEYMDLDGWGVSVGGFINGRIQTLGSGHSGSFSLAASYGLINSILTSWATSIGFPTLVVP